MNKIEVGSMTAMAVQAALPYYSTLILQLAARNLRYPKAFSGLHIIHNLYSPLLHTERGHQHHEHEGPSVEILGSLLCCGGVMHRIA